MPANDPLFAVGMEPRHLNDVERAALRARLRDVFPRFQGLLEAAQLAASGPDPEAAQVFVGMLITVAARLLFPR